MPSFAPLLIIITIYFLFNILALINLWQTRWMNVLIHKILTLIRYPTWLSGQSTVLFLGKQSCQFTIPMPWAGRIICIGNLRQEKVSSEKGCQKQEVSSCFCDQVTTKKRLQAQSIQYKQLARRGGNEPFNKKVVV